MSKLKVVKYKVNQCDLTGCAKPIHKYVGKVWGGVGLCKKHYAEDDGNPNINCVCCSKEIQ